MENCGENSNKRFHIFFAAAACLLVAKASCWLSEYVPSNFRLLSKREKLILLLLATHQNMSMMFRAEKGRKITNRERKRKKCNKKHTETIKNSRIWYLIPRLLFSISNIHIKKYAREKEISWRFLLFQKHKSRISLICKVAQQQHTQMFWLEHYCEDVGGCEGIIR